jgi:outer membrane protein assembly factor BamB
MSVVDRGEPDAATDATAERAPRSTWRGALRYALALLTTSLPLPIAFVQAIIYSTLVGRYFNIWWLADAVLVAFVAICVTGVRLSVSRARQAGALALALAAWGCGCWIIGANYVGGSAPRWAVSGGFFVASLWNFWLGWIGFWPLAWRHRLGVLGVLGLTPLAFLAVFVVDDISGDEQLSFRWRWATPAAARHHVERIKPHTTSGRILPASGEDFPQYLGPERNGRVQGPQLERDWNRFPPQLVWRIPVGAAWSGFALAGDLAITQEQRNDNEGVVAYQLATGQERWAQLYPARFAAAASGDGPRATPTVADGRVYAMGATGRLTALELDTGKRIWAQDVSKQHGDGLQVHGASASPLLVDDLVIVCPSTDKGSVMAAYRRPDGHLVWSTAAKGAAYSSPALAEFFGERQIVHFDGSGLNGYRVADGVAQWQFAWRSLGNNIAQPLLSAGAANQVLLTSADGGGAALVAVAKDPTGAWSAKPVWQNSYLKTKFSTPVIVDHCAYGLDNGILECLDLNGGKLRWKKGRYRHGQVLLVGDLLLVLSEEGILILVDPQPSGLVELGSIPVLTGKTWNTLAIKGDLLVVRNATEAACFRVALAREPDQASKSERTVP